MVLPQCPKHGIPLVCYCPACRGEARSDRKAQSSRENGKRGGRPRKSGSLVKKPKTIPVPVVPEMEDWLL